jgi:hypothetical protein
MTQFQQLLQRLNACKSARDWAGDKTWQEVYNTCERGDWLLWLFAKTNLDDKRLRVLAAAKCAEQVIHLMDNERSVNAVKVAIAYGEGNATDNELREANIAAGDAMRPKDYAAYAAYYSARWNLFGSFGQYTITYTAMAADDAVNGSHNVSLKRSADIVRSIIPIEKWNIQ